MIPLLMPHEGRHRRPSPPRYTPWQRVRRVFLTLLPARRVTITAEDFPPPATALLAAPATFTCCTHCSVPTTCEVPDAHPEACSSGCNRAVTMIHLPAFTPDQLLGARFDTPDQTGKVIDFEAFEPVPGDRPLSGVREQWNAWHDDTAPSLTLTRPVFIPSEVMTTGELAVLDTKVDTHLHPELDREFTDRPDRDVLKRVLGGLRNWDPKPVQGEAPQDAVDEAQRLAAVMQQ
jgi:hypothetical protein